jgi:hypothetical protein
MPSAPEGGTVKRTLRLDDAESRENEEKSFLCRIIPLLFLGK